MYPSNYRSVFIARRRQRLAVMLATHVFIAAVSFLAALAMFASAVAGTL